MAGNAVLLKHSAQTPRCAERFAECFAAAGLPVRRVPGVAPRARRHRARDPRSARRLRGLYRFGGRRPRGAARGRRTLYRRGPGTGGCDPVYVRHDADLPHAIENIVDGAYFNSGQSCCGLQRIYVHESVYEGFAKGCTALVQQYQLGNPLDTANHPRAGGARQRRRLRSARRFKPRSRPARAPVIDERAFPLEQTRHALSGAATAARCAAGLGGHARGDLRPGGRRHEGALRCSRRWR